jgi:nucleoside-diphosphate-sugar epimerase
MRILVTGANGFVGTGLVPRLIDESGFIVRVAARHNIGALPDGVEQIIVGESLDANLPGALANVDAIVHLAARVHLIRDASGDPLAEYRRANVATTANIARAAAAAGVKRFVFISSIKVNGESGRFSEADLPAPRDAYGVSKHEAEILLRDVARETGMEGVIVRPPLVYGPMVRANFRSLIEAVARGIPLPLRAVNNRRSLVGRDNLADFIATCLKHSAAANETFLVSDGEDLSTPELIRRLASAMGRSARLIPVPEAILIAGATLLGKRREAQRLLGSLQVDISKARQKLGWAPPISVDEGLRRAIVNLC